MEGRQWTQILFMTSIDEMRAQGVLFAPTREGTELPVIDLAHPRFSVPDDPAAIALLRQRVLDQERRNRLLRGFLLRYLIGRLARKSRLMQALFRPGADFLDGLSTYAMKLGVENLVPPFDGPGDRIFAAGPHLLLLRLRMQQVARLLAEGLARDLPSRAAGAPLHLVNIGGGPAMDSLNALIFLHREHADLLRRPIRIHVLDGDEAGPWFGARALDALCGACAPLADLDIGFAHIPYDWRRPDLLERFLTTLRGAGAIAASSEGALFEYGDDQAVIGNLDALRAGGATLISGSVTSGDPGRKKMIASGPFRLFPRGVAGFAPLAHQTGFTIEKAETAVLSDQILLRPAA